VLNSRQLLVLSAAAAVSACGVPVHGDRLFGAPPPEALRTAPRPLDGAVCQVPWKTTEQLAGRAINATTDAVEVVRLRLNAGDKAISAVMEPVLYSIRGHIGGGGGPAAGAPYDAPDISAWDLRQFAMAIHARLLPEVTRAPLSQAAVDPVSEDETRLFEDALGFYFTRLFRGDYIDRFGHRLTAPAVSRTVGDSDIASTLGVLIDAVVDFAVRAPVWTDSATKPAVYYPAEYASPGGGLVPTAVAFTMDATMRAQYANNAHFRNWILLKAIPEPGAAAGCGMDRRKLEVVAYLAQLAQQKASGITGIALGSAGGFGFSLGAFGKISVGDNQTIQVVARTVLSIAAERIAAELAYRAAYTVPDQDLVFSGILDQVARILASP